MRPLYRPFPIPASIALCCSFLASVGPLSPSSAFAQETKKPAPEPKKAPKEQKKPVKEDKVVNFDRKFTVGQQIRYKVEQSLSEKTSEGEASGGRDYTVLLVVKEYDPEKGTTLEAMVERMRIRAAKFGKTLEWDSTNTATPKEEKIKEIAARTSPMIGVKFTLQLEPSGAVSSVRAPDSAAGAVEAANSSIGGFKELTLLMYAFAPQADSASVGESWSGGSITGEDEGTKDLEVTMTLKNANRVRAEVAIESKPMKRPDAPKGGVVVRDPTFRGKFIWNPEQSLPESTEFREWSEITDPKNNQQKTRNRSAKLLRVR